MMVYFFILIITLQYATKASALCEGFCVMGESAYWKAQTVANWGTNALYYVCRFAKDARENCNAPWDDCIDNYVTTREWFNLLTFRSGSCAQEAGKAGYNRKSCDKFM